MSLGNGCARSETNSTPRRTQTAADAHREQPGAAHEATLQRHSVPNRLPSSELRRLAHDMRAMEHADKGDSVAAFSAPSSSHSTGDRHFFGIHGAK